MLQAAMAGLSAISVLGPVASSAQLDRDVETVLPDWGRNSRSKIRREKKRAAMTDVIAALNASRWARTTNLRFRRPMLYPIELEMHMSETQL
jgi:hypothetical protein